MAQPESSSEGRRSVQRSSRTRFHELYQHHSLLLHMALRLTRDEPSAEDLVHETYLRALRADSRPSVSARAFLFGMLRHVAADWARDQVRRRQRERRYAKGEAVPDRVDRDLEDDESLAQAFGNLDEASRCVFRMRYQEDLSLERIAHLRGESLAAVKSRLHRGKEQLRRRYSGR